MTFCAKDDAAGQAIANRFSSQINGLNQATRNANDGISIAQTAEGALGQVNDNVQRIRDLVVQAGNSTNSSDDLQSIQDEIDERVKEIDRISEQTDFNDTKVLNGDATGGLAIQVGANDGEKIDITIAKITAAELDSTVGSGVSSSLADINVTDTDTTSGGDGFAFSVGGNALGLIDDALQTIDSERSQLGAIQNRFESAITNLETNQTNLTDARSRIEDADFAEEVSNQVKAQILQQAGTSVLAQANQTPQNVLSLLG